jgi:hypothetical protein
MSSLHLSILPPPQRRLWDELSCIPDDFTLYGGTAIALRLGHRESLDFNFFARTHIDPTQLIAQVACLADGEPLQMDSNTLTARVDRAGAVLLSFLGVPRLPVMREPQRLDAPALEIGDLLELGGMQALVVQKRAEAKDYLDIHALLTLGGYALAELLAAADFLYRPSFTAELTLKSLCYFDDGNLAFVPAGVRRDLLRAARACDPARLPAL